MTASNPVTASKTTASKTVLLVVDDDDGIARQLKWAFDGFQVQTCGDRPSALAAAHKRTPAVVLLDLGLPPNADEATEGLTALEELLAVAPSAKVIVMTGQKDRSYALRSVALGAYDFYQKPLDLDELGLIVERARRLHEIEQENKALQATQAQSQIPGLLTTSPQVHQVSQQVARIARTDVAVLITGESGTGKELVAQGVHALSPRDQGPFVAINCAAIPENLLESELFGHEKGAFTGAHKTTIGKVEQAHKGTLFLDEIGEMPMALQAKMLRVLQERMVERVGGRTGVAVDFRLVAATNRDLEQAIKTGAFREDLFYRIGEAVVTIPPLRERPEDAMLIAQRFLQSWAGEQGLNCPGFAPEAMSAIMDYEWPGNVRELQSRIKRAAAVADGRVTAADLQLAAPDQDRDAVVSLKEARRHAELDATRKAMAAAGGNLSEAARLLEVSRPRLYQLLDEHGLR
ncbi:PEP-CTERM-box response regulator transcription factor [Rhodothalassium salexigens]|uniref:PEP-CTERM-box response regulator transcription factor n=1 Tax=Rhodothalassium salexigens TaxID=1086 RepID=UPI00191232E2|nr:PEP-CTERM-box response regulator transcription factor [Rhodothalassium salexigens]MBK5910874.1 PEP-CTERM-box response regulator transcription factor [Rhodothalassium salexigens]MBK5920161.1 PEP-CTERM-box response regulator transcription factor [Rhodothalassium salexigens]